MAPGPEENHSSATGGGKAAHRGGGGAHWARQAPSGGAPGERPGEEGTEAARGRASDRRRVMLKSGGRRRAGAASQLNRPVLGTPGLRSGLRGASGSRGDGEGEEGGMQTASPKD